MILIALWNSLFEWPASFTGHWRAKRWFRICWWIAVWALVSLAYSATR